VIPTVVIRIASGRRQVRLGAVTPTRDFTYVADTVTGFISALECDRCLGEVINIGSNFEISIGDTAQAIADIMDVEIELVTDERRVRPATSEVGRLWASTNKARELMGWQPAYGSYDGFRKGLTETIAWFRDPGHLAAYKPELYNL